MESPTLTIKQGKLRGVVDTDIDGNKILKFLDIPYAKPPTGELRFRAPLPAVPWNGILDASKNSRRCFGETFWPDGEVPPMEDALLLNVYTRELPGPGITSKPVMVFIHGGSFTGGSGSERLCGPHYLLTADVVLVAINYRLGIFGFLSLDDDSLDIPGNAGLKDQVLALKWLQENISSFNGDPKNVTIFGISAGGAAVQFLGISSSTRDLFHKTIVQSGSVLNPWSWGQKNAIKVCEKMGVVAVTEKEALEILMKASAEEIYKASLKLDDVLVDNSRRRPFGPVIEKPNPSAFLIQEPIEIFRSGRFNHVPTMIGTCSNEGFVYEFILKLKNIKLDPHEFGIPWSLGLKKESQDWKQVGESLSHFYYKDGVTSDALAELCGDASFLYGVFESARLQLQTSKSAVYPYIFNYECPLAQRLFLLFSEGPIKGVSHGGESTFLFSVLQNTAELQNEDKEAIRMIVKIWTSFAKTGIPHECWKPAEVRQFKYFYIDKESELREGFPFPERLQIWKKIIKKFGQMTFEANVND